MKTERKGATLKSLVSILCAVSLRGYKEKANINTPMELAINNEIDRFSVAMDVIKRTPKLQRIGAHALERFRDQQTDCRNYAYEHGIDNPEIVAWRWPY
jgi:xylulose-5-phosphate/fructose-6-phosphate phosphoketolase